MSRSDLRGEAESKSDASATPDALDVTDAPAAAGVPDAPGEPWMLRDDEFLLDEDREYVRRDEGRSWRSWCSPVAFGVLVAAMVGDAIAIGAATAAGSDPLALLAPVVAEVGLRGLLVTKAAVAVLLVLLPGVTDGVRSTRRAAGVTAALVGLLVVTCVTVVAVA